MLNIGKRLRRRDFVENVGRRLWELADLDHQPQEVKDHYRKVAAQRVKQWFEGDGGLGPLMADTVAFSVHTEAENSWAAIKKEMDDHVVLQVEKDAEDDIAEEADYMGWLKKKGYLG